MAESQAGFSMARFPAAPGTARWGSRRGVGGGGGLWGVAARGLGGVVVVGGGGRGGPRPGSSRGRRLCFPLVSWVRSRDSVPKGQPPLGSGRFQAVPRLSGDHGS